MGTKAVVLIGITCIVIVAVFGLMCHLMMSVNPEPLHADKLLQVGPTLRPPKLLLENGEDMINPMHRAAENDYSGVTLDYRNPMLYTIQRVVPPLWPLTPEPPLSQLDEPPKDDESKRDVYVAKTEPKDVFLIGKRSVDDSEKRRSDLDSIILKVTDDRGKFNIEIKISTNDTSTKKQIETREIQSKDIPKYSMSLKTKYNDLFKISELAKSTIIHVKPNDSVSIDYYDHQQKPKGTVNDNIIIQASIIDLINRTDKSAVMSMDKDVLPIAFFSNKTKLTNHSDTNAKEIDKNLSQKPNHIYKTSFNSTKTANDTACNITVQIENTTLTTFVTTRNDNKTKSLLL